MSDQIQFADDNTAEISLMVPWKVLITDDEPDVHEVTELALKRFTFDDRPLEFLHAYSAAEARDILRKHPDIAIILLDVVMETDNAGLEIVKFIREELGNKLIRIVLRTGQPGYAPEREVIANYDINDYKSKTELTAQKLFTTMVSSLRTYKAESSLRNEKEKVQVTLQSITDSVISTDVIGRVKYMNSAAEYMLGVNLGEVYNQLLDDVASIINPADQNVMDNLATMAVRQADIIDLGRQVMLQRRDGEKRIISGSVAPLRNSAERITGAVLTFQDMTLSQNMEDLLNWQQSHDALTDLLNRKEFETHIYAAVNKAALDNKPRFLLYLDIDNFKVINDTCGHVAGDKLLVDIGNKLMNHMHKDDILGRVGADEFGILVHEMDETDAMVYSGKIMNLFEDYHFKWHEHEYVITASIGMVPILPDCEGISCVLSAANMACTSAKESHGNSLNYFHQADNDLIQKMHELSWANKLSRSIQKGQFHLYCQKICLLDSNLTDYPHYELLVRMKSDDGELLSPNEFIPAAEKYRLMPRIDRWIINRAIKQLSTWHQESGKARHIMCSINLSGASLTDDKLIDAITATFERYPFPPEQICFEVTETATIEHLGKALRLIETIKALGCKFSLDDFGSGLSSFSYLRQLPVDFLKIDGMFVKDIDQDDVNRAMVKTINDIGHIMNIKTIAEYVESQDILDIITEIGVDYGQGFAIEKPRPFGEMLRGL